MEGHLEDVKKHYRNVFPKPKKNKSMLKRKVNQKYTIQIAEKRLKEIKDLDKRNRKKHKKMLRKLEKTSLGSGLVVNNEEFFEGFSDDQKAAGTYFIN